MKGKRYETTEAIRTATERELHSIRVSNYQHSSGESSDEKIRLKWMVNVLKGLLLNTFKSGVLK